MTWHDIPPHDRAALLAHATRVLTGRQLAVWTRHMHGYGYRRISIDLGISISTARTTLHAAQQRLENTSP